MRVIGEIPHPDCKITLFSWNNKYLIKLEKGPLEQTFKVSEMDVTGEDDIHAILSESFMQQALERFDDMFKSLSEAMRDI